MEPQGRVLSYGQLCDVLDTLTSLFRLERIRPNDTVAVVLDDGLCGLAAVLASTCYCACCPINPALTLVELRADLLESGAAAIILSPGAHAARAVAEELGLLWIEAAFTAEGCTWRASPRANNTAPAASRFDNGGAKLLLHTSATVGRRKVVALSTANLHAMVESSCRVLQLNRSDRLLNMARLFHTQGILSPFAQLLAGGSVIFLSGFTIQRFRDAMEELQPSWYTCSPALHGTLLNSLAQRPLARQGSLRFVRSGGSPLPPPLRLGLESVLQVPVLDVYGLTEAGGVACTTPGFHERHQLPPDSPCVGVSMGPEIAVIDSEGDLLTRGEGEIVIRGPSLMMGYRNDEGANREVFCKGWFHTGDFGRLDPGGLLFVTGRLKEMINRGGQKIVPNEIDAVLVTHPAVHEVAAFAVSHPTRGEDVACAVVLKPGSYASETDLRIFMRSQLARFKIPRRIHFLDEIPHGATGKPQRLLLRERLASDDRSTPSDGTALPKSRSSEKGSHPKPGDLHRRIAAVWRRHLPAASGRLNEDFFVLGGDPVSAAALLLEIEEGFGLKRTLPRAEFLDRPTLACLTDLTLCALAGQASKAPSSALEYVEVRTAPDTIPLFLIPPNGDEGSHFRRLGRHLGMEFSLALLRPENKQHLASMYAIQHAAAEAVELLRKARPRGPYVLGGFCYGGVIAFEAARLLEIQGERVLLVLFDVPMPGSPHPIWEPLGYAKLGMEKAVLAWRTGRREPWTSFLRRYGLRLLWVLLRRMPPSLSIEEMPSFLRRLREELRAEYFPLYRPHPTGVSVHHFMAQEQWDSLHAQSRHGWRRICSSGVTVTYMPGSHMALLSKSNLPAVAQIMSAWLLKELHSDLVRKGADDAEDGSLIGP